MLDLKKLRENRAEYELLLSKRVDNLSLDSILDFDEKLRKKIFEQESLLGKRNVKSKEISLLKRDKKNSTALELEVKNLNIEIKLLQKEVTTIRKELNEQMDSLPNVPYAIVPSGGKENNVVIKTNGNIPEFDFEIKDHVELSRSLKLIDYERGVKLGGSGFWIYTGRGAALEWALLNYFCQTHYKDGYTFMLPPHLLLYENGYAAGQFPKFRDEVFHIESEENETKHFLLPTSETAILNTYRDEILSSDELPLKIFAYSPCYRSEKGGARTEERGTIRGHQFNKVELFQVTTPEQSEDALKELIKKAESLLESLGLHYQTTLLAAKDASSAMAITYDIEVWLPSLKIYKEVSSASCADDYQARRAKIRYKNASTKKKGLVYTLNGSGLATSRLVPAILEQNQQADGSVIVPEVLRPWLGVDVLK